MRNSIIQSERDANAAVAERDAYHRRRAIAERAIAKHSEYPASRMLHLQLAGLHEAELV